jgi:glycosyltransferase involved in cell wall biosynthesis
MVPSMTTPQVSVVIPARNAASRLARVLDALAHQTAPAGLFEVIVVDDGSTDGTAEVARAGGRVRLLRAPPQGRQAAARNYGAAESRGRVLAFLDADCVPRADWIERGLAELDAQGADLLAGQIGMEVAGRASAIDLLALGHDFDQERYASEGFAAAGNLWVKRSTFEEVGGFDTDLAHDEDREFTLHATAGGAVLRFAAGVAVDHPPRTAAALARRSYRTALTRGRAGPADLRSRLRSGPYAGKDYVRRRLQGLGYEPGRGQVALVHLAKWVCIRAPMAFGTAIGTIGRWWRRRDES